MKVLVELLVIFLVFSCSRNKADFEYYVFSKQDSMNSAWRYDSNNNKYYPPPPPPPPPPPLAWYSDLVMIFDTSNRIYLYQTECINREIDFKNGQRIVIPVEHPNLIGLNPNQIITLHSNYIMEFITDNNEYFKLDTNDNTSNRIIYFVSDFDTIKNPAYYNLKKHIKMSINRKGRIIPLLRKTTEEERNVLSCKRIGKFYDPKDFAWSTNYFDGKTKPFSSRYDSLESLSVFLIRSKETFNPEMTRLRPIE